MIDRRAFLHRLGFGTVSAAAAAVTFDIEKLLWVPKPIITVPATPMRIWMSEPMALSHGVLLTGGTLRALMDYTRKVSDQAYMDSLNHYNALARVSR